MNGITLVCTSHPQVKYISLVAGQCLQPEKACRDGLVEVTRQRGRHLLASSQVYS